jgi:AcrR family transcriptional regulator
MPQPDANRRQELLRLAADYVQAHGLSDLSLRPLAAALNTSGRMLIYYFGSKEQLLLDLLAEVRHRTYRRLEAKKGESALRGYWCWASSKEGLAYLRLVYEVYGLSLREPDRYADFLAEETREVVGVIAEGYRATAVDTEVADALATYTFAGLRGIELDFLGTGDRKRADAAFAMFEEDVVRRLEELVKPSARRPSRAHR